MYCGMLLPLWLLGFLRLELLLLLLLLGVMRDGLPGASLCSLPLSCWPMLLALRCL